LPQTYIALWIDKATLPTLEPTAIKNIAALETRLSASDILMFRSLATVELNRNPRLQEAARRLASLQAKPTSGAQSWLGIGVVRSCRPYFGSV
jgi:hypothetical protein